MGNAKTYLVLEVKKSLAKLNFVISHIYREGNVVVDFLAKLGAKNSSYLNFTKANIPKDLLGILRLDKIS